MQPERHLVIALRLAEQVAEPQRGAVTQPVPQLRVPGVDQELDLHVVQEIQLESLVPVEIQASGPHNSSRLDMINTLFSEIYVSIYIYYLVNMIDLYDTIEVTEPLVFSGSFEAAAGKEMDVEATAEPHVPGLAVPVYFVLDEV